MPKLVPPKEVEFSRKNIETLLEGAIRAKYDIKPTDKLVWVWTRLTPELVLRINPPLTPPLPKIYQ